MMSHMITMNSYKKFIEKEREYGSEFLKSKQILDERFSEDEYTWMKPIWEKSNIIDDIYMVIDDIIGEFNFKYDLRFLMIGDLLFSLKSGNLCDPGEIILKTTRNDYLNKIKIRSILNEEMCGDWSGYHKSHQKLLIGLRLCGLLTRNIIRKRKNESWESIITIQLSFKSELNLKFRLSGICKKPFVVVNMMDRGYSIGSFRDVWDIKRKKREMDSVALEHDGLIRSNQTAFRLSKKLLTLNSKSIEREEERIIKENKCLNLDEYFGKVKRIVESNSYNYNISSEIWGTKKNINNDEYNILEEFQNAMQLKLMKEDIFDKEFYISSFMDNRGRLYYNSGISPTFQIMFRNLYEFVKRKKWRGEKNSIFYKKILEYGGLIDGKNDKEEILYKKIVLLIEVGKFFIKNNEGYLVRTEDIINIGKEKYKNRENNLELKDRMYLDKIYWLLNKLNNDEEIDDNTIIFKDATASGLQNYGILLGYKDEMLKYLNLDGNDWCDTYKYVIKRFVKSEDEKYLKRKYWKGTIMTIPYNSVWHSCFIKFLEKLREDGIDYKELKEENRERIKTMHKNFYNDVKSQIKIEFYKNESKELKKFKYNKWSIVSKDEYKVNYKNIRDKYINTIYMIDYDEKATERAEEANNMHYLDAELVKFLLRNFEVITIHDCFGIRLSELHLLMDKVNEYYSNKIGKKIYGLHILL